MSFKIEHFLILNFYINTFPSFPKGKCPWWGPFYMTNTRCKTLVLKFKTSIIWPINLLLHTTQAGATLEHLYSMLTLSLPILTLLALVGVLSLLPFSHNLGFAILPINQEQLKCPFFLQFFPSKHYSKPWLHFAYISLESDFSIYYCYSFYIILSFWS